MRLFKDIHECIKCAQEGISSYGNIKTIIVPSDYVIWENKLEKESDYENYLVYQSKLNLLNLSILTGYSLYQQLDDPMFSHYKRLLSKLDIYLGEFPQLSTDRSFISKIKNIEQYNFLSTLTELSLASYFARRGLMVTFETPFTWEKSGKRRDVDLTIRDSKGSYAHIDVYMPNKQIEFNGFFDLKEDDYHIDYKIGKKLQDKFGVNGIVGLNGTKLLAVNTAFIDTIRVKSVFSFYEDYSRLARYLPESVDGILLFCDDFGSDNSLGSYRLILKET